MKYKRLVHGGLVLGVLVLAIVALFSPWVQPGVSDAVSPVVRPVPVPMPPAIGGAPFTTPRLVPDGAGLGPHPLPVPEPEATPGQSGNPMAASSDPLLLVPLVAATCGIATLRAWRGLAKGAWEKAQAPQARLTACQECG
jgi:hypothetical protein